MQLKRKGKENGKEIGRSPEFIETITSHLHLIRLRLIYKSATFILPKPVVDLPLLSLVAHTVVPAPSAGHLPDHAPGHHPVDDGAEDLAARHPAGRAAEVRSEELPGPG